GRLMQRPSGIGQMRTGDGAEIGAARRDDGVRMIGFEDRTNGDGGNADFVADPVGERRLEETAVDWFLFLRYLARRAIDDVRARVLEQRRDLGGVLRRD